MFPLSDIRAGPPGSSPKELKEYKKLAESMFKFGDPRRQVGVGDGEVAVSPGFRILDSLTLIEAGRYTIKAVMDTRQALPESSAPHLIPVPEGCLAPGAESCARQAEQIKADWAKKTPAEIEELRKWRAKVELEDRQRIFIESKVIEFEVVPSTSPGPALKLPRPLSAAEQARDRRMVELLEGKRR
ncbi:MAG: hypothetical protein FD126_396 [Elusimicrobia bacterium]|nr:MAG: hypothetical protein FD126_396 [Elusimicrobiota bacterium]